jgi:hypothetical protein
MAHACDYQSRITPAHNHVQFVTMHTKETIIRYSEKDSYGSVKEYCMMAYGYMGLTEELFEKLWNEFNQQS